METIYSCCFVWDKRRYSRNGEWSNNGLETFETFLKIYSLMFCKRKSVTEQHEWINDYRFILFFLGGTIPLRHKRCILDIIFFFFTLKYLVLAKFLGNITSILHIECNFIMQYDKLIKKKKRAFFLFLFYI